ncbi:helix-turn-helix transcriptional regulator [Clostridium sp. cel8]|uniref:helix-turn-helix domain-containing protein n=1 Tax=Clostridium sp. cel8 TaxID=2663123 RepID=UPI0015F6F2B5|nr:helix-turn-helix transcriptional regulator [Clostridium sp. cel8]MBA5851277.1 helix-turn-helix transcriptional regulator [Clostridium sp. cel8]
MEILSIGEKIKRARIYRNMTLKEVCGENISPSKLCCIENGKMEPDYRTLEYIAEKLEIDGEYLKKGIRTQIIDNINMLDCKKDKDYIEKLKYNLMFAEENSYYDLCFQIAHKILRYYIKYDNIDNVKLTIPKYYVYLKKDFCEKNFAIYYMDIGAYMLKNREYLRAFNYYENALNISKKIKDKQIILNSIYYKSLCLIIMEDYNKVSTSIHYLLKYIKDQPDLIKRAGIYFMCSILSIVYKRDDFSKYEKKVFNLIKEKSKYKFIVIFMYVKIMFDFNMKDKALNYLDRGLEEYSCENYKEIDFLLLNILDKLIENNFVNKADKICSDMLNRAIECDNVELMEGLYSCKAYICEKQNDIEHMEIYMNFSLSFTLRLKDRKKIYKKYIDMGNMYYKLGNTFEAIKYFNSAMNLKKYDM